MQLSYDIHHMSNYIATPWLKIPNHIITGLQVEDQQYSMEWKRIFITLQQPAQMQTWHHSSSQLNMVCLTIGTIFYLNSETIISSGNTYTVSMQ